MINLQDLAPCGNASGSMQLVIAVGMVLNTALNTFLVHRRLLADRRALKSNGGPFVQDNSDVAGNDDARSEVTKAVRHHAK